MTVQGRQESGAGAMLCVGGCGALSGGSPFIYLPLFLLEKPLHDVWVRQHGKSGWIQAWGLLKGLKKRHDKMCLRAGCSVCDGGSGTGPCIWSETCLLARQLPLSVFALPLVMKNRTGNSLPCTLFFQDLY